MESAEAYVRLVLKREMFSRLSYTETDVRRKLLSYVMVSPNSALLPLLRCEIPEIRQVLGVTTGGGVGVGGVVVSVVCPPLLQLN